MNRLFTSAFFVAALLLAAVPSIVNAQPLGWSQKANYADRKAIVLNTSPHIQLGNFSFENAYTERGARFEQKLGWTNIGSQPVAAFEVIVLKYDAFDQRLTPYRWLVNGTNSADWTPLGVGATSDDGVRSVKSEDVMTAIAFVRSAKLADGTVWRANEAELLAQLKKSVPKIREFGALRPDGTTTN